MDEIKEPKTDIDFTKEAKQDKTTPTYHASVYTEDDFEDKKEAKRIIKEDEEIRKYWLTHK